MRAFLILLAALLAAPAAAEPAGKLSVVGTGFELSTGGQVLRSPDLAGATFEMNIGPGATALVRIERVEPAAERPAVLLHTLSVIDPATGAATPLCDTDAQGRQAAFPLRGRFDGTGAFHPDKDAWLLTCTSGSQGKCVLWGYDPWASTKAGASMAPYYEACQHVVRADYDGKGAAHTKDGTQIDVWDEIGVQIPTRDPIYLFEAGWSPKGAVCVARTRWP
ncbi:MAG: ADYC domain-containing protein, partial [Caulobacteraceae bacterium]